MTTPLRCPTNVRPQKRSMSKRHGAKDSDFSDPDFDQPELPNYSMGWFWVSIYCFNMFQPKKNPQVFLHIVLSSTIAGSKGSGVHLESHNFPRNLTILTFCGIFGSDQPVETRIPRQWISKVPYPQIFSRFLPHVFVLLWIDQQISTPPSKLASNCRRASLPCGLMQKWNQKRNAGNHTKKNV